MFILPWAPPTDRVSKYLTGIGLIALVGFGGLAIWSYERLQEPVWAFVTNVETGLREADRLGKRQGDPASDSRTQSLLDSLSRRIDSAEVQSGQSIGSERVFMVIWGAGAILGAAVFGYGISSWEQYEQSQDRKA
jgi:hypothetical protein